MLTADCSKEAFNEGVLAAFLTGGNLVIEAPPQHAEPAPEPVVDEPVPIPEPDEPVPVAEEE